MTDVMLCRFYDEVPSPSVAAHESHVAYKQNLAQRMQTLRDEVANGAGSKFKLPVRKCPRTGRHYIHQDR